MHQIEREVLGRKLKELGKKSKAAKKKK